MRQTRKLATILAGFTLAGLMLGAGPATAATHPTPVGHSITPDGKDWEVPGR